LRKAGILIPILVLGAIHETQIPDLIEYGLEFTISSKYKADLVAHVCDFLKKTCRVHLEVDTGMQRTGVRPKTAVELFDYLKKKQCFEVVGIYSHFATAEHQNDAFAKEQIQSFDQLMKHFPHSPPLIRHMANSNGALFFPQSHLDMVRPALATFGYIPKLVPQPLDQIRPCFTLKSKIAYFKVVEKGQGISYGHTHKTSAQTRVVTIPVGYGDGYRRCLSNKGSVLIRGKRFPIVGTICMDQFMVDIGQSEAFVGDEVVLIGKQGLEEISLQEVSDLTGTIVYETLCGFNNRIPRVYIG
jgi:alanine racemase